MKPHSFLLLMQVKRGRIPKKNTGRYAGFGFIEFGTKQEALNAKKALSSTHFYGRRLVSLMLCTHLSSLGYILNSLYEVFAGARVG